MESKPRTRKPWLAAGAAALALAMAGLWWRAAAPAGGLAQPDDDGWALGQRYRYALEFQEDSTVRLDVVKTALSARTELTTELVITPQAGERGERVLAVSFARPEKLVMRLGDQVAPASLDGSPTYVRLDAEGAIADVWAGGREGVDFELARMVLGELQAPGAGAADWTGAERLRRGAVLAEVHRAGARVEKVRSKYTSMGALPGEDVAGLAQDVRHRLVVTLAPEGHPLRAESDETTDVAGGRVTLKSSLRLRLIAVEATPATRAPEVARVLRLDEHAGGAVDEEALLAQHADGLTWSQLEAGLLFSRSVDPRFFTRATALLELHPELCAKLIPLFLGEGADFERRRRIMDLLAAAGHGEAQRVMRELLATGEAHAEGGYVRYVQSFSFVAAAEAESTRFLAGEVRKGRGDEQLAAAHALGSSASTVSDRAEAAAAEAALKAGLAEADDPAERAAWIAALGNSANPEHLPLLSAAAGAEHGLDERAAATRAIGRLPGDGGLDELIALAGDRDRVVQRSALHQLHEKPLTAAGRARAQRAVAAIAVAGGIDASNVAAALDVLEGLGDRELLAEALVAMRPLTAEDAEVAARLERLYSALQG